MSAQELLPGNKHWKLLANLEHALCCGLEGIVAVGGRRSTLLHSLARAADAAGIDAVGIVPFYASSPRSGGIEAAASEAAAPVMAPEPPSVVGHPAAEQWIAARRVVYGAADGGSGANTNTALVSSLRGIPTATLSECTASGMGLLEIPAVLFRQRIHAYWYARVAVAFPRHLVLPEGGSNWLAVQSVARSLRELLGAYSPTHLAVGTGTGATAAGAALAFGARTQVLAYQPAGIAGATANICGWMQRAAQQSPLQQHLSAFAHPRLRPGESRFGQLQDADLDMVERVFKLTGVLLDPLYGVCVLRGVLRDIAAGHFTPEDEIVILHTGGLQSWHGFEHRCNAHLRNIIRTSV